MKRTPDQIIKSNDDHIERRRFYHLRIQELIRLFNTGKYSIRDLADMTGLHYSQVSELINLKSLRAYNRAFPDQGAFTMSENELLSRSSDQECIMKFNTPTQSPPSFGERYWKALKDESLA